MWVRSQDKKRLMNVEEVVMVTTQTTNYERVIDSGVKVVSKKITIYTINSNSIILGTYSTEEKALKVLTIIEKFINVGSVLHLPQDCEV